MVRCRMNNHDNAPAIALNDVSFSYNGIPVIESVNIAIQSRELVTIVGPNGGGKTTLLRLILGLIKPDKGSVRVLGQPPQNVRHRIGYTPQYFSFDPQFPVSVMEVVLMGRIERHLCGDYAKNDRQAALKVMEELELADLKDHRFCRLSGGQRQRVLIARALIGEPDLLLLDEPTANVDAEVERKIHDVLQRLQERMAILLVSHDPRFVSDMVEHVLCVNRRVIMHPTSGIEDELIRHVYGCSLRLVRHDDTCPPGDHDHE